MSVCTVFEKGLWHFECERECMFCNLCKRKETTALCVRELLALLFVLYSTYACAVSRKKRVSSV